jgi:hypothetical protein
MEERGKANGRKAREKSRIKKTTERKMKYERNEWKEMKRDGSMKGIG